MISICTPIRAACFTLVAFATVSSLRAENWELTPGGAGVIDHDAGLVWGALNTSFGASGNVDWATAEAGCRQYGLTAYNETGQYSTGWRMPTLAEAQTATSNNGWHYFNLTWAEGDPVCWTATKQSSSYWAVQFMTGATGLLNGKNGRADFRPVRSLESWTYRADLGGWLDNQTGLVWGPGSSDVFGGVLYTWAGASNKLSDYRVATGRAAFRLATAEEVRTAIGHNAIAYFEQTMNAPYNRYWTSEEAGRQTAWVGRFHVGEVQAIDKKSAVQFMGVYRP